MGLDFGSFLGGGLSGAASGSAFGPIGTIAGGLLGGLGGMFSGGSTPTYQPTELQQSLADYATKQVIAGPKTRKRITREYQSLTRDAGNRGAAEAFLESYRDRFANPEFIEKKLAKSYAKPIDYSQGGYWDVANQLYGQQGLGFTGEEFGQFVDQAKSRNIRSPQAFGDMLKAGLVASGKVMTPEQERLSYLYGTPYRDPTGKITNMYPTRAPLDISDLISEFTGKSTTSTAVK